MTETKEYTAREVQDALEAHTWPFTYTHYEFGYNNEGLYTRLGDGVDRTEIAEFEWSEAEDSVGTVYDVLGGVEVVASDPGGEGHGEDIWIVVRVNETGQYFRIEGCYASHGYGSQYDGPLYSVNAVERTVTFYE